MGEAIGKVTQFDTIEIRYYPVVLSDNPAGEYGPPIELGWEYITQQDDFASCDANKLKVDAYESERQRTRKNRLYLSQVAREAMLRDANYSENEMKEAMRQKKRARFYRSANNLILRINLLNTVTQTIRNGIQTKKLKRARKNLRKLKVNGVFHEHSDIYKGWWAPM
jgi:hypothetical protein